MTKFKWNKGGKGLTKREFVHLREIGVVKKGARWSVYKSIWSNKALK